MTHFQKKITVIQTDAVRQTMRIANLEQSMEELLKQD